MSRKIDKSILFIRPDYHCSFFYCKELKKLGWKADIFVEPTYPQKLLYSTDEILTSIQVKNSNLFSWYLNKILNFLYYISIFWKYKYHVYYSRPSYPFDLWEKKLLLERLFGEGFSFSLSFAKLFARKIIYLPAGCHDLESKEMYLTFDKGNVCNNCGSFNKCDDKFNNHNFKVVRRYANMVIGDSFLNSTQFSTIHFKYKLIDLQLWHPEISIPEEFKMPNTGKLRVLHSYVPTGRDFEGRNIKGSKYILEAINRLIKEGYPIEYFCITNVNSNKMRFMQIQADILIDQLIYGSWGSTGVECMALGKPVICYMRETCKEFFLKNYPEHKELPIIEADTNNIYEVLKKVVVDKSYRMEMGRKSRNFAELQFDSVANAKTFEDILVNL
jgi:hypothetical protein